MAFWAELNSPVVQVHQSSYMIQCKRKNTFQASDLTVRTGICGCISACRSEERTNIMSRIITQARSS